jgi:NitT/TauT family transport system ATP-binding protein
VTRPHDRSDEKDQPQKEWPTLAPSRGRLEIKSLSKFFGRSRSEAVYDINLKIEPGEFVVIVGPSGSGKSTILNMVAGLLKSDEGEVILDGARCGGPGPDRALVFQDHGLFPWLTAAQNVEFGLKMVGIHRDLRQQAVRQALQTIQLEHVADKLIHELSGGMRQRLSIARALVMNPAVLLMDEPFSGVDAMTRLFLHDQMQKLYLNPRKTVLFVTHSVGEAVRLGDRIIVLHARPGRIRREIKVDLPRPRKFDSPEVREIVEEVRSEIIAEVLRVHAELGG